MKKTFIHIIFFVLACMLITGCRQKRKLTLPSLNETYSKDDKRPFGGYAAYHVFKEWFEERYAETNEKPFDEAWVSMKEYSTEDRHTLYMLLTKNLEVSDSEADAMVSFVKQGNDLFIAADYIDEKLLDKINCKTEREQEIISEVAGKLHDASVKMNPESNYEPAVYQYYYYPYLNSFSGFDPARTRVLGVNEINKPNYILLYIGQGRLYLHADPRTFSNYFILTKNNYLYVRNVLSYLRFEPNNIFWDEYYKNISLNRRGSYDRSKNKDQFSSFNVINRNPPLLWAFWLAVIAIISYILFNIKRKQKVINELKPNINSTVNFTETVGRLYLEKKNNKNISEKMITYFYEHVRNSYFLDTNKVNSEFINSLSRKSGVSPELTQKLFNTINQVQAVVDVDDMELLTLNELIQNFNKNKN